MTEQFQYDLEQAKNRLNQLKIKIKNNQNFDEIETKPKFFHNRIYKT